MPEARRCSRRLRSLSPGLWIACLPLLGGSCVTLLNAATTNRAGIAVRQNGKVPPAERREELRVMTYNIAHARGPYRRTPLRGMGHSLQEFGLNSGVSARRMFVNLDRIVALIRYYDPDLVLLNEVDFEASWSHGVDQLRYIAERTPLRYYARGTKWHFASLLLLVGFHCGNAVLSKIPISGTNRHFHATGLWQWLIGDVSYMDITVAADPPLNILHAHIDGSSLDKNRQGLLLANIAARRAGQGTPVIVTGDLNARPPAARLLDGRDQVTVVNTLVERGRLHLPWKLGRPPGSAAARSLRTSKGKTIDYVLLSDQLKYRRCFVPQVDFSDHRPMICDIALKAARGAALLAGKSAAPAPAR